MKSEDGFLEIFPILIWNGGVVPVKFTFETRTFLLLLKYQWTKKYFFWLVLFKNQFEL